MKIKNSKFNAGFTVIEAVVMSVIVAFLAGTILIRFGGLNDSVALSRSARELALALRQAQSYALGVAVTGGTVPPLTGVRLSTASGEAGKYTIFSDLDGGVGNLRYNDPPDIMIQTGRFERNVKIKSLFINGGAANITTMHVLFSSPEAQIFLTDDVDNNGDETGSIFLLEIELESPSGDTQKVTVRVSGQISVVK